jgi:hypothetical protein
MQVGTGGLMITVVMRLAILTVFLGGALNRVAAHPV